MTKLRAGALALAVTLSLGACSTLQEGLFSSGTTGTQRPGTGAGSVTSTSRPSPRPRMTAVDR
jgi:hypothetical protein